MKHDEAKDILGASRVVQDDKSKVWYVKMPQFIQLGDRSLLSPELQLLDEDESDLNEYLDDPTDPVVCVPEQDHDDYWTILRGEYECTRIHRELLEVVRSLGEADVGSQDAFNSCFPVYAK